LYFFDFFNVVQKSQKKFLIIFENIGLETLSFITILQNNFSFLKLKKIEKHNLFNDFESNFQLNLSTNKIKLNLSTFCLIVSNNPRYEGYYLNLYLKKRFSKGNFECCVLGSLTNLTFFTSFLGSSSITFVNIIKGKHLICQKLKSKNKPFLILNSDFFKRADRSVYLKALAVLQQSNLISTNWNGLNVLNYSLCENGIYASSTFSTLKLKDLFTFSALYFLNIGANNSAVLKKLTESKLLNYFSFTKNKDFSRFLILDQSHLQYNKSLFFSKNLNQTDYVLMPNNTFYENEETFINTKGSYCKTIKLITKEKNPWFFGGSDGEKTKSNWQILRRFVNNIREHIFFCSDIKNNITLFPTFKTFNSFKNFINFNFFATIALTNLNFYLNKQTKPFVCLNYKFKQTTIKIYNTKLNYWLNDFFIGGKDEYSYNSKILNSCSNIIKKESTLFF